MSDHIISVRPLWARAFFTQTTPKTIELRKTFFGASLEPGNKIVIYSTKPEGLALGTVRVAKREIVHLDDLWEKSEQGALAKVSEIEFRSYYYGHYFGVGIWVEEAEAWERTLSLTELREHLGDRWQPPQQIQKLPEGFLNRVGDRRHYSSAP